MSINKEKNNFDWQDIIQNITKLLSTYLKLFKLEVYEEMDKKGQKIKKGAKFRAKRIQLTVRNQIVQFIGILLLSFFLLMFFTFILVFANIGLVNLINSKMQSEYWGYFIISLSYFMILGLVILLRKQLKRLLINFFAFLNKTQKLKKLKQKKIERELRSGETKVIERS